MALQRSSTLGCAAAVLAVLVGCTPTVAMKAPEEPITINLNIRLDAEVRVRLAEQAEEDIEENPDVF